MVISSFLEGAAKAVFRFNDWARVRRVTEARADHLCYKCGSRAEFEALRNGFEPLAAFIHQSQISQRAIALVQFTMAWHTPYGEMRLLELSDQKPDGSQKSGFDHIELYPASGDLASLARAFDPRGTLLRYEERPHHSTYDGVIFDGFRLRLESEPLLRTVMRDEISRAFT